MEDLDTMRVSKIIVLTLKSYTDLFGKVFLLVHRPDRENADSAWRLDRRFRAGRHGGKALNRWWSGCDVGTEFCCIGML